MARVLIVGAGIAGPIVAMQLARVGIRAVLVERANSIRTAGQTLDINGFARKLVDKLGVEPAIRQACTGEEGTFIVDDSDRVRAALPVGYGPTNEYEIVRHRLCKVFYDASKAGTEYRFGDSVRNISQTDREVTVDFEKGQQETYDAVVIADGLGSRTRSLVFEDAAVEMKPLGVSTAYFSIPPLPADGPWSRIWFSPGRRAIWLRPAPLAAPEAPKTLACLLIVPDASNQHLFTNHRSLSTQEQKKAWRTIFQGTGWQTDRVLRDMEAAEDFHSQEMAQVKIGSWHRGRVVVIGDAACCPSPLSGMGTSHAVVSAYVLGQQLASSPSLTRSDDVTAAFNAFESIVRPYAEKKQADVVPPWLRALIFPQTQLGVRVLQAVLTGLAWLVGQSAVQRWAKQTQEEEEEGLAFEKEGSDVVVASRLR